MTLERLPAGCRFQALEEPTITGTLIHVCNGSALVELDGKARVRDFETLEGWKRIIDSGRKRTTITKALEVRRID